MLFKYVVIIVLFILSLYFYCFNKKLYEGFVHKKQKSCPNILVQKGDKIFLKNTNLAEIPGINPVMFNNLEEYVDFMDWQKSQGINCDVLFLKHEYDAQGYGVLKIRPDIIETSGGSQAKSPGNIDNIQDSTELVSDNAQDSQLLTDSNHNDPGFNNGDYPGFDSDNQYIGISTPIDSISKHGSNIKDYKNENKLDRTYNANDISNVDNDEQNYKEHSSNAMDSNWIG